MLTTDAFADRVFEATLGYFQILSLYLGLRLGLYEVLADEPLTADALAARAGIDARYAREWCEQQATIGIVDADVTREPHAFRLRDDAAESLLDPDSVSYLGATIRQLASLRWVIDPVVDAYRTGDGLPADAFGAESADGQGGSNRPVYLTTMPTEWLPNIEQFHTKLSAGATTVIDIGCGHGWSSIALALAYPGASVDGYDPDAYSLACGSTRRTPRRSISRPTSRWRSNAFTTCPTRCRSWAPQGGRSRTTARCSWSTSERATGSTAHRIRETPTTTAGACSIASPRAVPRRRPRQPAR
jgi:winged helix-turn-helix protein